MATTETARAKKERLEARVTPEQKALFQRAADVSGQSLTNFMVGSLQAAAEKAIRAHRVIQLSERDSLLFAEAILNPGEPNEELRRLAADYRSWVADVEHA